MGPGHIHDSTTLGELFVRAVCRYGDRTALSDETGSLTYAEMAGRMRRYAGVFIEMGLGPGKGFSVLSANRIEAVVALAAGLMIGMRYTPLHPKAGVEDHVFALNDAEIDLFVVDDRHFADHGRKVATQRPGMQTLSFGGQDYARSLDEAAATVEPAPLQAALGPDEPAFVVYTGGTTGRSKGVVHKNRSLVTNLLLQMSECELPQEMRFLAVTPISHAAFLFILPTLLRGGELVLRAKFAPIQFIDDLHTHRITATFLVPTMIYVLLDRPEVWNRGCGPLQTLVYGASPMSPARLAKAIEAFGRVFVQVYGQVECPNIISVLNKADHDLDRPHLLSSCGFPSPAVSVALMDDDLNPVPPGEVGEICARSPLVMEGYWKRPDATKDAMGGGWLRTGDMGRRDEHGYLFIEDRKKDLIISGGFNVFPSAIENVLDHHPEVATAVVLATPDEKWGEAVLAVVVPKRRDFNDAAALIEFVRDAKGSLCAPKRVEFLAELPLTPLGKPDRKALRARYWTNADRKVN
jgi:fatty-acyl-CoA synthase